MYIFWPPSTPSVCSLTSHYSLYIFLDLPLLLVYISWPPITHSIHSLAFITPCIHSLAFITPCIHSLTPPSIPCIDSLASILQLLSVYLEVVGLTVLRHPLQVSMGVQEVLSSFWDLRGDQRVQIGSHLGWKIEDDWKYIQRKFSASWHKMTAGKKLFRTIFI